jgi:RNA polymerase sigma factor (TIGR02999 family)
LPQPAWLTPVLAGQLQFSFSGQVTGSLFMSDLTCMSLAIERDDARAAEQLLPLVYDELRKLAAMKLAQEKPGQTLQATALVHEAYVRLVDGDRAQQWESQGHFFAAAAEAMRRILVENARRKRRRKHGGALRRIDLDGAVLIDGAAPMDDLIALDEALKELAAEEPVKAKLVRLRYFAGLTIPEAAELLGISTATAERYWTYARTWLYCALNEPESTPQF